jgi:protein gp37
MNKTKIDWADMTWNPVTGCYHNCEYCYARKIANRFDGGYVRGENYTYCLSDKAAKYIVNPELQDGKILIAQHKPIFKNIGILDMSDRRYSAYPFGFCPTIHEQRLHEPAHKKKPQNIFVCSMADIFGDWVPDEWISEVFKACEAAPQHRYLFLTKNPKRYLDLYNKKAFPYKDNYWFGTTITKPLDEFVWAKDTPYKTFISIEPILEPLKLETGHFPDWVIIGAETGNRKDKVTPKKEWIDSIAEQCKSADTPLFMKESLRELMGEDFIQEFPWEVKS